MTVELKNLATGKVITEKFVTNVSVDGEVIRIRYDQRIRHITCKTLVMDQYAVVGVIK